MKILFILDPLASLKTYKDTSLAIVREAARLALLTAAVELQEAEVVA